MRLRATAVASLTALALPLLAAGATAAPATSAAADENPWLSQRVLNMAHSGGEDEAPTNTMYAFKRAVDLGADMIELDVQSTKDKKLVVLHNSTLDETTNATGKVVKLPWRQVKKADAGYWFVRGEGTTHDAKDAAYTLRGARDGERRIEGYSRADFRVPLLKEVLKAFPKVPINIEIKGTSDDDAASFFRTGRLLSTMLNKSGRTDVIVTSFDDAALVDFHARSPQIGLAPGRDALTAYFLGGTKPMEGTVALQVPVTFSGITVVSKEFVARAHADGYAVHVWFSGSAPDNAKTYAAMLNACADGLMPAKPTVFERILDRRGIERPGQPGTDPCG
ncbi:glycerophosphodiester phosphodiesterase family protein [Nocardioides currus]|uniref:Glycerophosphodiester phosphodiesterase n=1 Tax=Nocardioides currus TaxID=2133958 RepID=A0A2R7YU28_9ACTN|nr:glycerophosphodiester phosphodiesterase family protein [Nocardioides currus]PUA79877.1 glycerophosphodiester phosphodiesterase [Nocardioides currus]